jgi:hypothetical protein
MQFSIPAAFFLALVAGSNVNAQSDCSATWKCMPISTPPTLDADHSEWADVEAFTTDLLMTSGTPYDAGVASYKCLYDSENIYFALEIPGEYRFSSEDNHLCAAIATMFKIGAQATYVNMGGCPDAIAGCSGGVPDTCDEYRVDIGAHWELAGTNRSTFYGWGDSVSEARQAADPPGNDPIANNDDEYSVSPYCRFDDDDADAGNEWAGAWTHTDPTEGEFGTYHFEIARRLTTPSTLTDAQLTPGETYQFGVAFWDPFESEQGWSDIGHYLTGCATNWIDLELVDPNAPAADEPTADAPVDETTDAATEESRGVALAVGSALAISSAVVSFLM